MSGRQWAFRIGTAVGLPLLLLGGLEAGLRLAGQGFDPAFTVPCRVRGSPSTCENPDFSRRFFPASVIRRPTSFAFSLGWFVSRLVLTAIFLLVVTPIALVARLAGKRFLETRPEPGATSYWLRREAGRRDDHRKMY